MARDRKIVENQGVPEYATYADMPNPTNFKGLAFVQDTSTLYKSNGIGLKALSSYDTPNMNLIEQKSESTTGFTAAVTNNGTIVNSSVVDAKGITRNGVLMATPQNTPAGSATLTKDWSVKFSEDESIPLIMTYYVPRLATGNNINFYPWISNSASLGSANRSRFITPAAFDAPGWRTTPLDKRTVGTSAFGAFYIEQQGTAAFDFAQNLGSFRYHLSGSTSVDLRTAMAYNLSEGLRERPKVCITFDDSTPSSYHIGYKEAKKRNITYTNFAIYDSLSETEGSATGMTVAQLREITNDPLCYIGLHGNAAFDGTGTGAGLDPYTEMKRNIDGLKALNLSDCKYMSWPNGGMGQYVDESVAVDPAKSLGVLGSRYTIKGYQYFNGGLYNPYAIQSFALNTDTTLVQAKAVIDQAISWGCSVTFYGHKLGAVADSLTWVTADYIALLDYIATKRSIGLIDDMRFDNFMQYGASI